MCHREFIFQSCNTCKDPLNDVVIHHTQVSALWKSGLGEGFRVPALLRFVNGEDPYLAMSNGGPRMYINMEDHVSHSLKKPNIPFEVPNPTYLVSESHTKMKAMSSARWDGYMHVCMKRLLLHNHAAGTLGFKVPTIVCCLTQ